MPSPKISLLLACILFLHALPTANAAGALTIKKKIPVEITSEGTGHTFAVLVTAINLDTCEQTTYATRSSGRPMYLAPGNYKILTEASRKGFPQEARYDILNLSDGTVISAFPKSHVGVNNIDLTTGRKLRITVEPATRPYNSSFFTIGGTNVAIVFPRPYPTLDYQPGQFQGSEQFSSVQIAMGFYGMKYALEQPAIAQEILKNGVKIPSGEVIRDPEMVLGAREVAKDLSQKFFQLKATNTEDVRGSYHASFLIERTRQGKIPASLLKLTQPELQKIIEEQLLWMLRHNIHRPGEGGGYAWKSFEEDFQEGKKKALQWPEVSIASTNLLNERVALLEKEAANTGMDKEFEAPWEESINTENWADIPPSQCGPNQWFGTWKVKDHLRENLKGVIKAAKRELKNYENYPKPWLVKAEAKLAPLGISTRTQDLNNLIKRMIDRLKVVAPGHEAEFLN